MDLGLQGKVAVVTGSSRGLGLASARALVAEGCHVCISGRGEEALAGAALGLASAASGGAEVLAVAADLSTEAGVARVVDATINRFGGIDVLVNNVALARGGDLLATSDADWQEAFDQTLFPAIRTTRLVVPSMRARGGGAIVIISSIFGREAGGRMTYNAVKAAEISLAKSLAQQLAKDNIRVNSVSPGLDLFSRRVVAQAPAGRPRGHRRVRQGGAAVRPLRARRGSRRRRGVPRQHARQLDQRHVGRRRRLPEPRVLARLGAAPARH